MAAGPDPARLNGRLLAFLMSTVTAGAVLVVLGGQCGRGPRGTTERVVAVPARLESEAAVPNADLIYQRPGAPSLAADQVVSALAAIDTERAALQARDLRGAKPHACGSAARNRLRVALGPTIEGSCPGAEHRRTAALYAVLVSRNR